MEMDRRSTGGTKRRKLGLKLIHSQIASLKIRLTRTQFALFFLLSGCATIDPDYGVTEVMGFRVPLTAAQQASKAQREEEYQRRRRPSSTLDPTALIAYGNNGTGKIEGEAFFRLDNGRVVTCAGSVVNLYPKTLYLEQLFDIYKKEILFTREVKKMIDEAHSTIPTYVRSAPCDSSGRFSFSSLPLLNYYLISAIENYGRIILLISDVNPRQNHSTVIISNNNIINTWQ